MSLPLGALAFAPLGPEYIPAGLVAGFLSSIVANAVSALTGGNPLQISGPRASISLIMAGLLATMLAQGADRAQALVLALVCLFLSGLLQIAFGALRLGRAARYVPYPVFAGFVNGVGLVIILGQLAAALGLPATVAYTDLARHVTDIRPGSLLVAAATIATMIVLPRVKMKVPPIVGALFVGSIVHQLLFLTLGPDMTGPVVALPPAELPSPVLLARVLDLSSSDARMIAFAAPAILILAALSSLEAVMSSTALDALSGKRSNPDREMIGQGLGNLLGACFGAVPSTGAPNRGIANYRAGGRTRAAAFLHSVFLFALLMWGATLLALLPYAVLAGIMIMIGWGMTDGWSVRLARRYGGSFMGDCATMALVSGLTVFVNLAFAVFIGFCITIVLFLFKMSRPIVQQWRDRNQVRSRRVRPLAEEKLLAQRGHEIVIVGLDGPLYFGTAAQCREDIERGRGAARTIILDLRRVPEMDVSGARMLRQIRQDLRKENCDLMLAGLSADDRRRQYLDQAGIAAEFGAAGLVATVDGAIERAEQMLVGEAAEAWPVDLGNFGVLRGLDPAALDILRARLQPRRYGSGATIFRGGDASDGLHLISTGMVDIVLDDSAGSSVVRLATFQPGTVFGEMALLSGERRSATAMARTDVGSWFMSNEAYAALAAEEPRISNRLLINIGSELAERLRLTNAALQAQI